MYNFIKYEIKGNYKFILGAMILLVLLTIGVYSNIMYQQIGFMALSILIMAAAFFASFLYIANLFRKELYEDYGYLTFTIPLSGKEILGGKLLTAIFFYASLILLALISNFIGISLMLDKGTSNISSIFEAISYKYIIFYLLFLFFTLVLKLLTVYFSMAVNRMTFRSGKFKSGWFVLFIILSMLISFLQVKTIEKLPYYVDIETGKIKKSDIDTATSNNFFSNLDIGVEDNSINNKEDKNLNYVDESFMVSKDDKEDKLDLELGLNPNIENEVENNSFSLFILNIVLSSILFLLTAYIIENKINL